MNELNMNEVFSILEQQLNEGVNYPQINVQDLNSDEALMLLRQAIEEQFRLRVLTQESFVVINGTESRTVAFILDRDQILVF